MQCGAWLQIAAHFFNFQNKLNTASPERFSSPGQNTELNPGHIITLNLLTVKLFNLNFRPLEVLSR